MDVNRGRSGWNDPCQRIPLFGLPELCHVLLDRLEGFVAQIVLDLARVPRGDVGLHAQMHERGGQHRVAFIDFLRI